MTELESTMLGDRHGIRIFHISILMLFILNLLGVSWMALARKGSIQNENKALKKEVEEGPHVALAAVEASSDKKKVMLVGEARPYYSVTLYARVSGFMTDLFTDIGKTVKKGELLAVVESPEVDQSYQAALADSLNKRRIANRNKVLLRKKLISQQEADQAFAAAEIADASLKTQKVLRGYQKVTAPFDGVITQRFVDPGTLIQNASASQAASQPLFNISQIDRLRIYIYVDQKNAPYVRVGDVAEIRPSSHPESKFSAAVTRISGELDPKTRTLLVELQMSNQENQIIAGSFVQVYLNIQTPVAFKLPVESLIMKNGKSYVAVVQPNHVIHLAEIYLVENAGDSILIRSGVQVGEKVALNLGNEIQDGTRVRPVS